MLLLLLEPKNSEFYSVAPDRELSSIVKKEIGKMIEASPVIADKFKVIKSEVTCLINSSKMTALARSQNRMDGRKANVFVADEVGALPDRGAIDSMESSQLSMMNRTGILISTAYQTTDNPMTQEVDYAEKVLDGLIKDDTLFALLYKPDDPKDWMSDKTLYEANPLCYDVPANYEFLVKKRNQAIEMSSAKSNFLTKHLNIFIDGDIEEAYVNVDDLRVGKIDDGFDWEGKEVYLGIDLAETVDNTAVSMVHYDTLEDKFYTKSWSFVPEERAQEKSKRERIDYFRMRDKGWAYFCGDRVINQRYVEDFVMSIQKEYGVVVNGIGYDRRNAISSVNRFQEEDYDCIEVRQNSSVLGPTFKLMRDYILDGNFHYESNELLENNFKNSRQMIDTTMNIYVNKKKSAGKIDMVYSTADAMYLWKLDIDGGLLSSYEDRGLFIL